MAWLIEREKGEYVNWPGMDKSYTKNVLAARRYSSKQEAEKDRCGNERIIEVTL